MNSETHTRERRLGSHMHQRLEFAGCITLAICAESKGIFQVLLLGLTK
jgi:hypothetical protein